MFLSTWGVALSYPGQRQIGARLGKGVSHGFPMIASPGEEQTTGLLWQWVSMVWVWSELSVSFTKWLTTPLSLLPKELGHVRMSRGFHSFFGKQGKAGLCIGCFLVFVFLEYFCVCVEPYNPTRGAQGCKCDWLGEPRKSVRVHRTCPGSRAVWLGLG